MDCPLYTSKSGAREGELVPYKCPIIYCPSFLYDELGRLHGNFSYSICVKHIDDSTPKNKQFIERSCETGYGHCTLGCEGIKEFIFLYSDRIHRNYSQTYSIGCKEGDQTLVQDKSSVFPPSSIMAIERPSRSSTSRNQASLMLPWFLILFLIVSFIQKKL